MAAPVLVVLNPVSSSGKAQRLRNRVEAALAGRGVEFELRVTESPGHAEELARRATAEGCETIVAVGGDGTVHEIAAGMLGPPGRRSAVRRSCSEALPSLAVVPVGTGNDFYRMVGVPSSPEEAVAVLTSGRRRLFDVGVARWEDGSRHFVNLLGVGIDVEVLRRRTAFARLPGLGQYLAALLVAVARFDPQPVRILLDGEERIERRSHLAAVTVGPSAGGGFRLNPDATPADGRLDLCFVEALSWLQVARCLPRIVRGTHGELDVVRLRRFRHARLDRPDGRPLHFELDGELVEDPVRWLDVDIAPERLPVLVPPAQRPS